MKKKIQDFKSFLSDYKDKNKYNEAFRTQSLKRISNIYISFLEKLNLLLYFIIVKRFLYEYENIIELNAKDKILLSN